MQLEARVKSAIDLLEIFFSSRAPFDIVMSKYFKNNRWIGANDRRAIAEFSYEIFRNFEKLKFITRKITSNLCRFFILAHMKFDRGFSEKQIEEIFSGRKYAPEKLSEFERKFLRRDLGDLPIYAQLNYPEWLDPYLRRVFDEDHLADEMKALNGKACVDLRVNRLLATKEQARGELKEFEIEDTRYAENGLRILNGRISRSHPAIRDGIVEIQDEGSQLIAELCGVRPGDTVVDYCAGAGGKTLALAAYMENKGRIFAMDKYPERLENAKKRFRRANVNNVFCQEINSKWLKRHRESADVVLVDVPCSGTGTWRRNPDMRAKFCENDLLELLEVQAEILRVSQNLVKPGGHLVYSTCSVLKEEDEDQIEKFLKEFGSFELQKVELKNYKGDFLRLTPLRNDTDGFFAAIMRKKS
ncbi:MAG: RsmB/NOP family class I SAM-dependent RNA methyltransferase [Alphaproteobacteria bacterium]|nr:RsmB/NOP family class I SAM-dependent RNA methyltransferase [Alphaproteobacteria bacterium]